MTRPGAVPSWWVNGCFGGGDSTSGVHAASVLPHDRGLTSGLGVFETIAATGGALPLWPRHLQRLHAGADVLGIPFAPPAHLHAAALELLQRTAPGSGVVRVLLTAGQPGVDGGDAARPSWSLTVREREPLREPVVLALALLRRHGSDATARVKCTSRAALVLARAAAREQGADDALLLDEGERVLETTTANLLCLRHGEWWTPPLARPLLPGIARALLLQHLAAVGRPVREQDLAVGDLLAADALVVTNAVQGPRVARLVGGSAASGADALKRAWQTILQAGEAAAG